MTGYHRLQREYKRRWSFNKLEFFLIKNKYLIKTCFTNKKEKYFFYYIILSRMFSYSYFTKQKDRCLYTNRASWVYKKFKMNRMALKYFVHRGQLNGVRTSSW